MADEEPIPPEAAAGPQPETPDLGATLSALGDESRASVRAALAAGQALRALVAADLALARAALWRALIFAGVAAALGAAAWLLLLAAGVAGLRALGVPWAAALLIAAAVGAAGAIVSTFVARRCLGQSGLEATRRQLARLLREPKTPPDSADAAPPPAAGDAP